ncbi:MAG: NAD(P)(+) transhydrogenase (Re/Si-specific) subunit alpha, partial [Aeromicrobium sp.]
VVTIGHAQVWGGANVPSQMPGPASRLLAQNIVNLLPLVSGEEAVLAPDFEDEIVIGACVTHAGEVRHEPTRGLLEGATS